MDLKAFACPFEWKASETCTVTLWYLPFRHIDSDLAINALEDISAQGEYVHSKTKERVTKEPDDLKRARAKAKDMGIPLKTQWVYKRLWNATHDAFWMVLPSVVQADIPPLKEDTPSIVRAFAAFYQSQSPDLAQRWADFRLILATDIYNVLWAGYEATRDKPAPSKPELAQATPPEDPLQEDAGSASDESTSTTSEG